LVVVVLVLGILWASVGEHYGVPDLFWNENPLAQFLAGVGVTLLLLHVCFTAYLLGTRDGDFEQGKAAGRHSGIPKLLGFLLPFGEGKSQPDGPARWEGLRWYLSWTWLPLTALLALSTVVYPTADLPWPADDSFSSTHTGPYWGESPGPGTWEGPVYVFLVAGSRGLVFGLLQRWPFLAGIVIAALVLHVLIARLPHRLLLSLEPFEPNYRATRWHAITAVVYGVVFLITLMPGVPELIRYFVLGLWVGTHGFIIGLAALRRLRPERRWLHQVAGLGFGAWFLTYQSLFILYALDVSFWGHHVSPWLAPPALVICLLLGLLTAIYGFLTFHFDRAAVSVAMVLLLAGALINGLTEHKLTFPGLESYYTRSADAVKDPMVALSEDDFDTLFEESTETGPAPVKEKKERNLVRLRRAVANLCARGSALEKAFKKEPSQVFTPPAESVTPEKLREQYGTLHQALGELEFARLENWKEQAKEAGQDKPKLVVVAVTGGANRSALWTTIVLTKLERELTNFPRHVRVISGASGGMVGASYWTATLPDKNGHGLKPDQDETFSRVVAQDSLTPVAQRLLFADLPMTFVPATAKGDRGRTLERAWSRNMKGALDKSFQDLAEGEAEGWRPSLIISPMLVEDGRRLLISNLYLPFLTENDGPNLSPEHEAAPPATDEAGNVSRGAGKPTMLRSRPKGPREVLEGGKSANAADAKPAGRPGRLPRYSLSAVEFFNLFPAQDTFHLSTAVRMNASFPYVSPAVELPATPRRRVVDAGYYDNYGVSIAAGWLYRYRSWIQKHTSGVILIQVRDSVSENQRLYSDRESGGGALARGVEWLTGPLVGAGSARESSMSFRNDVELGWVAREFNSQHPAFFTTVVFESREEVALNWRLTHQEIVHMGKNFNEGSSNALALQALREWWNRP
jgi:hypothetical protein